VELGDTVIARHYLLEQQGEPYLKVVKEMGADFKVGRAA